MASRKTHCLLLAFLLTFGLSIPGCAMTTDVQFQEQAKQLIEASKTSDGYRPPQGLVPDQSTAIAIAVAVWSTIYGADNIAKQQPYQAVLQDGQWVVTGTLPSDTLGGVAYAVISQSSGETLYIHHGR